MRQGLRLESFGWHSLYGVDLHVGAGQCIGLNGPSGAGKTLLLRAVADLDRHEGRAWVDGKGCHEMPGHQWRRLVGLLPAEAAWWFDTVGPHFNGAATTWLADVGFTPQVMDWEIGRLSSGERQRLSLLRLLENHPRVLLLDEPTANLDKASVKRVESLLHEYRRQRQPAVIWVAHDTDQLRRCCHPIYKIDASGFAVDGELTDRSAGEPA